MSASDTRPGSAPASSLTAGTDSQQLASDLAHIRLRAAFREALAAWADARPIMLADELAAFRRLAKMVSE